MGGERMRRALAVGLALTAAAVAVWLLGPRPRGRWGIGRTALPASAAGGTGPHAEPPGAGVRADAGGRPDAGVRLAPEHLERFGIKVGSPRLGSAREAIERPATVTFDLDAVARVGPRVQAKVVRVVKDLGEPVRRGEPVALMSSVELGLAKARYLASLARLETDRESYERENGLYADRISSKAEMLEAKARYEKAQADAEAAKETLRLYGLSVEEIEAIEPGGELPLSYFWLRSPIDGVVQRRDLAPGDSVGPGQTPVHVVDARRVWVLVDLFERDVGLVGPGQRVELGVRSLPGRTFQGVVDWVSLELEEETRTLRVRAVVENGDLALRAGMFGTARIHTGARGATPMVPVDAVQTLGDRPVVFVPGEAPGSFRPVPVGLGGELDGWVEVVEGLSPDQAVVVAGAFHLKSALTAHEREAAH